MGYFGGKGMGCKASGQRMEILGEWGTGEKPEVGPQRAFQTREGISAVLCYCGPGVCPGNQPLPGPPGPTLPHISEPSSPLPRLAERSSQSFIALTQEPLGLLPSVSCTADHQ